MRADGVEKLEADRDAEVCEVAEELAGDAETLVDLEGTIDVRVVDEAFPANGGAWLLAEGA